MEIIMTEADYQMDPTRLSGLPPVFELPEAAKILRRLGLTSMTECALCTRAYRKQVPFHRNGNRITFTVDDLKEIAEGQASRPEPREKRDRARSDDRRQTRRADGASRKGPWRARRTFNG